MTAHARTRPGLAERFADLFRGHRRLPDPPLMYPMGAPGRPRTWGAARWDHPDPAVYAGDPRVPEDAVYADDPRPEPHPPWRTAPQPVLAGPGKLDAFYAAADLRDQRAGLAAEHAAWYGWGNPLAVPEGLVRPYAPEPQPEPGPVSYPPLDLHADLSECVIFRGTVRDQLVRQEHARGNRLPGPWPREYASVFARRTAPVPALQFWDAP